MGKDKNKTIMIIALIFIFACGCPGCILLIPGVTSLMNAVGSIDTYGDFFADLGNGLAQGGWMLCLGGVLILVPLILAIIGVVMCDKKEKLEELKPTGASKDDPIPPTS
ncbi:MAG: hypothetical protein SVT56_04100 [Chloroflexota bacterium]|jgi:hypothetical protein|nr:hypothetical protein [Chloroflexota bacterium]